MKKWIFTVAAIVLLLLVALYIFIPNVVILKSDINISVTQKGLHRMLLNKTATARWWPGTSRSDTFLLNGNSYFFSNNNISLIPVIIQTPSVPVQSSIVLISVQADSISLKWTGKTITSYNPVYRIIAYYKAKKLNSDMEMILQHIKKYFEVPENIYGCNIKNALVVDSELVTTFSESAAYPSTDFTYSLIKKLQNYVDLQKGTITGYPMLNIERSSNGYLVKVALPLEKVIPANNEFFQKRMLKDGNILVTEVKGGTLVAEEKMKQMLLYVDDYGRNMPAIPFFSLITNRQLVPDSSQWVTKIYCPVR